MPPPTYCGARVEPWRARPVPFWRYGFLPPPRTSPRVLVSCVPVRRPASWAVTTWCSTAALIGAAKSASLSSTSPTVLPVRSYRGMEGMSGLLHEDQRPTRAGEAPLDEQQVAVGIGPHDADLLDGHALVAHVAGHLQAAVDAARRGAGADRPGLAVMVRTVGLGPAVEVVALDVAGKALALGHAGHIDVVARGEQVVDGHRLPELVGAQIVDAELALGLDRLGRLGQVLELAGIGLVQLARRLGAELHGRVAVPLRRAQARDRVGLDGQDADGHHRAVVLEDLGHADLPADE